MSEHEVDDLIGRAYDVAMGSCEWAAFLNALREFCGARSAALVEMRAEEQGHLLGESPRESNFRKPANGQPGTLLHLEESLQLLLDFDDKHSRQGAPARLKPLLPHIRRVVRIQRDLAEAGNIGNAAATAFADRMSAAVLLYDRVTDELLHANLAASQLLERESTDAGSLTTAHIRHTLRRALPADRLEPMPPFTRFSLSSRNPALAGVAMPLNRHNRRVATSEADRVTLIFMHDPNQPPSLQSQHLRARYGLTPKEARLALGVAYGGTLASLAGEFRVSAQTLKSQMKSVLKKVDVQSQAQMTAALLSDDMLLFAGGASH